MIFLGSCGADSKYGREITGERIELVKNEGYEYGPIDIDRLIIRVVPAANIVSGLISGEIDLNMGGIGRIQPVDVSTLQAEEKLIVESVPCFDFQYMAINDDRDYLTDDIKRAMNMAINKQLIVDQLLYGHGTVMHSVWPESHPYYADLDWDGYDPEAAKKIVEESGTQKNVTGEVEQTFHQVNNVSANLLKLSKAN